MISCRLLTFFKINFFKKIFQEHYQSVKQFGSRSGPNCLQRSAADDKIALVNKELTHHHFLTGILDTVLVQKSLDGSLHSLKYYSLEFPNLWCKFLKKKNYVSFKTRMSKPVK